jgi:hypothetical protein
LLLWDQQPSIRLLAVFSIIYDSRDKFQATLIGIAEPARLEVVTCTKGSRGDTLKYTLFSPFGTRQTESGVLESIKERTEDSIELLMQIDSDMNPFRDKPVLNEIIADIRKASSTQELRRIVNECLDAVKNVVATYMELNRLIEEVQSELIRSRLSGESVAKSTCSRSARLEGSLEEEKK